MNRPSARFLIVSVALLGSPAEFGATGIATASRTLNQLTAVMLTCIALVVPLTANLYTPRLVRLYATHPLIVTGLSILILSHLLILSSSFFPGGHLASRVLVYVISAVYLLVFRECELPAVRFGLVAAAFFVIWLVSILDNSEQAQKVRALFGDQLIRSETGVGASTASGH
jgi:hypothetical protein